MIYDFALPERHSSSLEYPENVLNIARMLARIIYPNLSHNTGPQICDQGIVPEGTIIIHPTTKNHYLYPPGCNTPGLERNMWRLSGDYEDKKQLKRYVEKLHRKLTSS